MPLKKQLSLPVLVMSGVGVIMGAGIYALVGEAAGVSGYALWLGFLAASIVAFFTGLSYAELSSMVPKAGAEFDYAKKAFGKKMGFLTAWLIIFAGVISSAAVAWGFGNYFFALTGFSAMYSAIALMVVCSAVVYYGVKHSTNITVVLTIVEMLGLLVIIAVGLPAFFSSGIASKILDFQSFSLSSIFQTAALVFFAYIGFEGLVRLSEETVDSRKNMPKALVLAIVISTIFYILVAVSALSVLPPEQLASSNAPLGTVAGIALGPNAFLIISIIALFSTANTVLFTILATSRIIYGIAEDNALPKEIAVVDRKTNTPVNALIITAAISIMALFFGNMGIVASATDFLLFIAFIIINLSVIKLRFDFPKMHRPFRIPFNVGWLPVTAVLGIAACVLLIASVKHEAIIVGSAIAIIGVLFEAYHSKAKYGEAPNLKKSME